MCIRDRSLSLELSGRDPDKLDVISYQLNEAPDGLRLSEKGRLSWRPKETGDYVAKVVVRDDGIPIRSVEQAIQFSVVDPPPPPEPKVVETPKPTEPKKPKFDAARFTYAIAMLEVSGKRQLWLQVRTSGKIMKLGEGDPIKVGSIDAKISRIGERDVDLVADGETFQVRVGEPLVRVE